MSFRIAGIGTALPRLRIPQEQTAALARATSCETEDQERVFDAIYRLSGVETRHSVVLEKDEEEGLIRQSFFPDDPPTTSERLLKYEAEAPPLAINAGRAAIRDAGIDPARITHLVTISCTGFSSPGVDLAMIKALGLDAGVSRTQVGFMGCHAAINGLRVAHGYLNADPNACVLMCAVELCSIHHQYGWNAERIVANALFADGAAAVVGLGGEDAPGGAKLPVVSTLGSTLITDTDDMMSWRIGDHGFAMTLSQRVPAIIGKHARPWLEQWLAKSNLTIGDIGSWAVHPGGPRILSAFADAAGLPANALETSSQVLADHGNMSSPTVLFIIDRLRKANAPRPWVAIAFGPGLAVEAALVV